MEFDAIVVGSGVSGGWAAKELCERGLKTLVLERGKAVVPDRDYTDHLNPWERPRLDRIPQEELERDYPIQRKSWVVSETTKHFWIKDSEHPYETAPGKPYEWIRSYQVGGRSLMWGRQSYRLSDIDFEANKKDGHGVDWPIRYADVKTWYDHVERFAGISGSRDGLPQLPDGEFQPPFELNAGEAFFKQRMEAAFPTRKLIHGRCAHLTQPTEQQMNLGRTQCQARSLCPRGCRFGAYFSSLSATLPAAEATGNLTLKPNSIVQQLVVDPKTRRITGVRVVDAETGVGRTHTAKVVFLCASAIPSAMILLQSASEAFPTGLANRSDQVGRNLTDHLMGVWVSGTVPGLEDRYYHGRRPTGFYLPRYSNVTEEKDYLRGFGFQGGAERVTWKADREGVGAELKAANRMPGPWRLGMGAFGEQLPDPNNRVTLHRSRKDKWGMPIAYFEVSHSDNDRKLMEAAAKDAVAMFKAAGLKDITSSLDYGVKLEPPGHAIHEMGTARMGRDPNTSVLNGWSQAHDVPNLFITDGAAMTSAGCQNPSLTYMMLSARAANHAADLIKQNKL